MKLLLQLSFRNLFRHKRRNAMLLLAIAVAVGGVNATNTLLRGFQMDMLNTAVASLTGHVKVHAQGYRDDPSISRGFTINDDYTPDVPAEALLGWAPRVRLPAVIMSERETRGVQIVGVDPAAEGISFLADAGIDGEFLKDEADGRIVIGRELARQRMRGGEKPKPLNLSVAGVKRLTLAVEAGEDLDLADHADWADARLIRPKGE